MKAGLWGLIFRNICVKGSTSGSFRRVSVDVHVTVLSFNDSDLSSKRSSLVL